jgi:hypothetical protein
MEKCQNCPLLNSDKLCPAQIAGHKRYCELVDPDNRSYDPRYVDVIKNMVGIPTPQQLPAKIFPAPEIQQPNIFQKAINFAGSLGKHIVSGFTQATPQQQQERLKICDACEFKTPQGNVPVEQCICGKCGCPLFKKTAWATSKCPIDKWGPVEPGQEPPPQLTGENEINMNQPSPCNCGK